MTRERKEIQKEIDRLYMREQAEYEMSCGFCTDKIAEAFAPARRKLYEKMAATYGKTIDEYEEMLYEIQYKLYKAGVIPFF